MRFACTRNTQGEKKSRRRGGIRPSMMSMLSLLNMDEAKVIENVWQARAPRKNAAKSKA
jgi:hypothetical protein